MTLRPALRSLRAFVVFLPLLSVPAVPGSAQVSAQVSTLQAMPAAASIEAPVPPNQPLARPTDRQVDNLATLMEVWGLLKYHHPAFTSGKVNADAELFRLSPLMIRAATPAERDAVLLHWIDALGAVPACAACAPATTGKVLHEPDLAWLDPQPDSALARPARLSPPLSAALQHIRANAAGKQFYVAPGTTALNPSFEHEAAYETVAFPNSSLQLLALARWWNIVEWWSPNRHLDPGWHAVLRHYLRPMLAAPTQTDYIHTAQRLIGEAHDTHAQFYDFTSAEPPVGPCSINAWLRYLGDSLVVWEPVDPGSGLRRGDVLQIIDGKATRGLRTDAAPLYSASNEAARGRLIAGQITRGACGPLTLDVLRANKPLRVTSRRLPEPEFGWTLLYHQRSGPAFQLLSNDVAYLNANLLDAADAEGYMKQAASTRALVVDLRNYPKCDLPSVLGKYLVTTLTEYVRFTHVATAHPGTVQLDGRGTLKPNPAAGATVYPGRLAILVDEETQSAAEFSAMGLRAVPGAIVVGSQTAGADGNVSKIFLPFGMPTYISGLGVLTPALGETQRVGVARDVEAVPTASGIAAGRDEVLEAAIRTLVGSSVPAREIERMARR